MTTQLDPRLMPAQNTTDPTIPTAGDETGKGVNAVASKSNRTERKRAWDEMTELDRAVLLETVRARRRAQQQKAELYSSLYGLRSSR